MTFLEAKRIERDDLRLALLRSWYLHGVALPEDAPDWARELYDMLDNDPPEPATVLP